jgi:hypothetical protein
VANKREQRVDFAGVVGKAQTLADGSVRIPARITRTGVFDYSYPDGRKVREYRPPEVVQARDCMDSFRGVAVTNGHPATPVDPSNWAGVAIGHVGDSVDTDGEFVTTDCIVKDAASIAKIAAGELREISCGYMAEIDATPGVTPQGEAYDSKQVGIVGNHVALGPEGWGRMGDSVRLYAGDSGELPRVAVAVSYSLERDSKPMTVKSDATGATGAAAAPVTPTPSDTVPATLYTATLAERDDARARLAQLEKAVPLAVKRGVDLRMSAAKVDSKIDLTKSDAEIMEAVIKASDPAWTRSDDHSDDYVRARYDMAVATVSETRDDSREGVRSVVRALNDHRTGASGTSVDDASDEDPIEAAQRVQRDNLRKASSTRKGG